jgi:hypothetical protein
MLIRAARRGITPDMDARNFSISELVEAISGRTDGESAGLSRLLVAHAWPGGTFDRTDRVASDWLSRWHPSRAAAEVVACACATGRCFVCN